MPNNERLSKENGHYTTDGTYPVARISPPPMKRQRARVEDGRTIPDRLRVLSLSIRSAHQEGALSSNSNQALNPSTQKSGESNRDSEQYRYASSASVNKVPQKPSHQNRSANSSFHTDRSSRRSSSGISAKPKCRVCMKDTNVKYNPIIACSTCSRQFHDSCRKPSLPEGADPQNWKCFKCEGGNLGPSSKSRKLHARASDASEPAMKVAARPDCASLDSVSIQSRSTKSCRSDENTEQNVSNVVSAVHKSGDTHPPLNGFDDECLGIDQHLRQDHAVEHSLNFLNVNPTELPFSGRSVDSTDSRRKFSDTNKSLDRSPISNQPHIIDSERTEVPNTPTQRSSQHNIPSPLLNLCGGPTEQDPLPSDGSLNIEPTPPARISFGTVLCTVCHKQRLLAKLGNTKAVCQKCQDQSRIDGTRRSEISETPESSAISEKSHHEKAPTAQSPQHGKTFAATTESKVPVVPWFQSGVVATTSKIKQKKVGQLTQDDTLSVPDMHEALPCSDKTVSSSEEANTTSWMYASKPDTPRKLLASNSDLHMEQSSQRRVRQVGSDEQQHLSYKIRAEKDIRPGPPSSSSRSHGEESTPISVSESSADSTVESEMEHLSPVASDSIASQKFAEGASNSRNDSSAERRYTMRQLARLALVSANGSRMTTSQIILWIARTFSHLRVGEGAWEKSVKACLSRFEEFDGRKISGAHENKMLYGFSDAQTRKRYETEHAGFFAATTSHSFPAQKAPRENKKRGSTPLKPWRAVKSAPSQSFSPIRKIGLGSLMERHGSQIQIKQANIDTDSEPLSLSARPQLDHTAIEWHEFKAPCEEARNNTSSIPFERSVPRQASGLLHLNQNVKRETTFEAALAASSQPSIETMTDDEKAQKIAEIIARPSRKKYFGSDHRLAHKRRHGLADIHDERHDAWKPPRPKMDGNMEDDVDMDKGEARTLRETFDLPDNMIPMNDGQTELAFRDGTLVNGRLPRPRNVYKVGKLFGGELTVRMS